MEAVPPRAAPGLCLRAVWGLLLLTQNHGAAGLRFAKSGQQQPHELQPQEVASGVFRPGEKQQRAAETLAVLGSKWDLVDEDEAVAAMALGAAPVDGVDGTITNTPSAATTPAARETTTMKTSDAAAVPAEEDEGRKVIIATLVGLLMALLGTIIFVAYLMRGRWPSSSSSSPGKKTADADTPPPPPPSQQQDMKALMQTFEERLKIRKDRMQFNTGGSRSSRDGCGTTATQQQSQSPSKKVYRA